MKLVRRQLLFLCRLPPGKRLASGVSAPQQPIDRRAGVARATRDHPRVLAQRDKHHRFAAVDRTGSAAKCRIPSVPSALNDVVEHGWIVCEWVLAHPDFAHYLLD